MMKVLVAVDGSTGSLQAVRHVVFLARGGLRLQAVLAHVQERPGPLELLAARDPALIGRAGLAVGEHLLQPARALLQAAGIPHEDEVRMADGDPAHALLEIAQAHHCAALVIGAQRTGLLRHVLLGSTARTLVAESPVPVTVVREHPEPEARKPRSGDGGPSHGGGSSDPRRDESDAGGDPDAGSDSGGGDGGGGSD